MLKGYDEMIDELLKKAGLQLNVYAEAYPVIAQQLERLAELIREEAREERTKELMQLFLDPENQPTQFGTATTECREEKRKAIRAEALEEAAKVCDNIENDHWNLYKGRPPYTGAESGRADPHEQGVSMGAGECAAAIRGLKDAC